MGKNILEIKIIENSHTPHTPECEKADNSDNSDGVCNFCLHTPIVHPCTPTYSGS